MAKAISFRTIEIYKYLKPQINIDKIGSPSKKEPIKSSLILSQLVKLVQISIDLLNPAIILINDINICICIIHWFDRFNQ